MTKGYVEKTKALFSLSIYLDNKMKIIIKIMIKKKDIKTN